MEQARAAHRRGDEQGVLDVLGMVRILVPEHPEARALQLEVMRERSRRQEAESDLAGAMVTLHELLALAPGDEAATADLARLRTTSDDLAARSSELRKVFDEAMDAFATGDLRTARDGFARVASHDADDREAQAMLRRVAEASRLRATGLVQQARSLAQAGRYDEAEALLAEARDSDPEVEGLRAASEQVAQGRQEEEYERRRLARERARVAELAALAGQTGGGAAPAAALSAAERQELATLYQRGMTLMDQGQADEALRHWELVWSSDPEFEQVAAYLQEEYLNRGMEAYAGGRLADAVAIWENALRVAPDDQRTRGYLERARQQLARIRELQEQDAAVGVGGSR
jgi:tetratricopeptide (TPR) repeat protein